MMQYWYSTGVDYTPSGCNFLLCQIINFVDAQIALMMKNEYYTLRIITISKLYYLKLRTNRFYNYTITFLQQFDHGMYLSLFWKSLELVLYYSILSKKHHQWTLDVLWNISHYYSSIELLLICNSSISPFSFHSFLYLFFPEISVLLSSIRQHLRILCTLQEGMSHQFSCKVGYSKKIIKKFNSCKTNLSVFVKKLHRLLNKIRFSGTRNMKLCKICSCSFKQVMNFHLSFLRTIVIRQPLT